MTHIQYFLIFFLFASCIFILFRFSRQRGNKECLSQGLIFHNATIIIQQGMSPVRQQSYATHKYYEVLKRAAVEYWESHHQDLRKYYLDQVTMGVFKMGYKIYHMTNKSAPKEISEFKQLRPLIAKYIMSSKKYMRRQKKESIEESNLHLLATEATTRL
jgi:hypothetical protein